MDIREIRFRAWDGEQMHENVSIVHGEAIKYGYHGTAFSSNAKAGIATQFAGLWDKNKAKIFEGDFVKGVNRINEAEILQKVTFHNGCFMFGNWNAHEYFNKHQFIEIIGNEFEHPHLLTKEES